MIKADDLKTKVEHHLRSGNQLGTLTGVVRRVEFIANDKRSSAHELAKVIGADAVLTARVLHVVNSASIGMEHHVETVDDAIVILGFSQIRQMCSGLLMADVVMGSGGKGSELFPLWKHSLATAAGASYLQSKSPNGQEDTDLFTAGLLCNIGRLVLLQWFPKEAQQVLDWAEEKKAPPLEAEWHVLGATHAEIGFWVAEFWRLGERLAQVIRHHHGPSGSASMDMVNLAYVIAQAKRMGAPGPGEKRMTLLLPGLLSRLKLDDFGLDQLLRELDGIYRKLEPMYRLMGT